MNETKSGLSVVQSLLQGQYYIIHFVYQHGSIESELIWNAYEDAFGRNQTNFPQYYGPFDSLESLTKFCFKVCDETDQDQVNIVSLEEFNQLIESTPSVSAIRERLPAIGNVITNPDASSKKGLFGKLFN